MARSSGAFGSFRKQVKKVDAFPANREPPTQGWTPKLGDRIQTPNGVGIVLKISGDMYLIDLEGQVANVWERLRSIKRLN